MSKLPAIPPQVGHYRTRVRFSVGWIDWRSAARDEAFTIEGVCERVEEPKPAAAPQAALTVWRRRRP